MKRILLTGMSGTGKSAVIAELSARGFRAIDTDADEWCEWIECDSGPDWIWREDRIRDLLATEDADFLFVSGCKSNQGIFYPQFDHVILLSVPASVMLERLATRTSNRYGKDPDERALILHHLETVEPLLRHGASLEIDTRIPIDRVIETIFDHIGLPATGRYDRFR